MDNPGRTSFERNGSSGLDGKGMKVGDYYRYSLTGMIVEIMEDISNSPLRAMAHEDFVIVRDARGGEPFEVPDYRLDEVNEMEVLAWMSK